ncbi:MAG: hypothetical protein AB9861_05220 [Methanosarcina sp.]|jgi:hypothetical protein
MVFAAIPLLFFVSYYVQKLEMGLKDNFSHKKFPGKNYPVQD